MIAGHKPAITLLGMALTGTSLVLMPLLGLAKRRLGTRLGSAATAGEGSQNLLCAYLGAAVLIGLAGNALRGWWWLDPVAGLAVAGVAIKEGIDAWRGKGCDCATLPVGDASGCDCDEDCHAGQ